MGDINQDGFLSFEIHKFAKQILDDHRHWFSLCEKLNRFGLSKMLDLHIERDIEVKDIIDSPDFEIERKKRQLALAKKYISAGYLTRALSNFQGIILLAEKGMVFEVRTILRCLSEIAFNLVAVAKNENFIEQLICQDYFHRRSALKAVLFNHERGVKIEGKTVDEINIDIDDISEQIKELKIKKLFIKDKAEAAGMLSYYDSQYVLLSDTIHSSTRDLEHYFKIDDDNLIEEILWGPETKGVDLLLFSSADLMIIILNAIQSIFKIALNKEWNKLIDQFNAMADEIEG